MVNALMMSAMTTYLGGVADMKPAEPKNMLAGDHITIGAFDLHRRHGEFLRPPYIGLVVANRVWFGGGWTSTDWRRGPTDDDARHRVTQDLRWGDRLLSVG